MKNSLLFYFLFLYLPCFAQQTVYQSFEVDSAAQPRGGLPYLNAFLQTNLRKPITAEAKGIGGRVIVTGIVETDGHVTDVKAAPSKFPELDREAVRVFSRFNAWQPAIKGGKAVRQQVSLPVTFKPNTPFPYVDGARVSYFDDNQKPVAEGSDQIRYRQVSPVDTNGLPNGDLIVYKAKGSNWKEEYRLRFVRAKSGQRTVDGRPVYRIGHQNEDRQWQGNAFSVDEAGALVDQTYYEYGRSKGTTLRYHANSSVAELAEEIEGKRALTSWHPNGQINQIWTVTTTPVATGSPQQVTAHWDSTGRQLVKDGNGRVVATRSTKSYADTTRQTAFIEQGSYQNGLKQGIWTGRYGDGSYFYEERYEQGICQGGKARTVGQDTLTYTTPEQQPEFIGGMPRLGQFLAKTIRYPADAQRARAQGRVYVSFVVCADGSLCDYQVLKSIHPSIDEEAVRVVKAMNGQWKPGSQRGQNVRVKYNMPINFTLQ